MGKRFNSGMGGYTCDYCNKLLYAGRCSDPVYCYENDAGDIELSETKKYCCKKCRKADEEWDND